MDMESYYASFGPEPKVSREDALMLKMAAVTASMESAFVKAGETPGIPSGVL